MVIILNFINFLKTNANARKIFGKKEIEIMIKQLKGFQLNQSEKNRLSRDIRPKLKFIEECSRFNEFFSLEKNMINKSIIEESVRIILNDNQADKIDSILLFGSFADSTFHEKSDIDIAVVFKNEVSLKEATLFRKRISAELNSKVDLQVFNILPIKIKNQIARNHKILFKSKSFDNIKFTLKCLNEFYEMGYRKAKLGA